MSRVLLVLLAQIVLRGQPFVYGQMPASSNRIQPQIDAIDRHGDLIADISRSIIWTGDLIGKSWFHPRACLFPTAQGPAVLITLQQTTGSDLYQQLHWSVCHDPEGRNWSDPKPIPTGGWKELEPTLHEVLCDIAPLYHPRTNTVLALGHNTFYRDGKPFAGTPPRAAVYLVRDADGNWSPPRRLEWEDPRASEIYSSGCSQRVLLPNGDIIIPMTYGADGNPRSVSTFICSFDGALLELKRIGSELTQPVGRGLLEPSLAQLGRQYFMTIRAEDGRGYVSVSDDGLEWAPVRTWAWQDGTPLNMSTTQQRWLIHANALYLVYTRQDASNLNVFRWRAPLYVARVDPDRLCLIKGTERTVFPLVGDGINAPEDVPRMGNFHVTAVSPEESWITVGEYPPAGSQGNVLLARVRWTTENRSPLLDTIKMRSGHLWSSHAQ